MKKKFRKYLAYAIGEMLLVIVGILIALQIDNWNSDRQEQKLLDGYLQSIARNMQKDMGELGVLREGRVSAMDAATRASIFTLLKRSETYSVDEIFFASNALSKAGWMLSFHANTSGFEALKTSGVLARMQGRDIERVLYEYYDTVRQIEDIERAHNEYLGRLAISLATIWPGDVADCVLMNPSAGPADRFEAMQPVYRKYFTSPVTREQLASVWRVVRVLLEYDKLLTLGATFQHLVDAGEKDLDEAGSSLLDSIYEATSPVGFPDLIIDGEIVWHTYYVAGDSDLDRKMAFDFRSVEKRGDSLHLAYPGGTQWGALWLAVGRIAEGRPGLDFSGFDKLSLEMKGDIGGEAVLVHIKDRDDPDDGTQTNVELVLTDDWQTYEIDLDRFETADLSALHIILGFLFFEEPQSFSIRNARYLRIDRTAT